MGKDDTGQDVRKRDLDRTAGYHGGTDQRYSSHRTVTSEEGDAGDLTGGIKATIEAEMARILDDLREAENEFRKEQGSDTEQGATKRRGRILKRKEQARGVAAPVQNGTDSLRRSVKGGEIGTPARRTGWKGSCTQAADCTTCDGLAGENQLPYAPTREQRGSRQVNERTGISPGCQPD